MKVRKRGKISADLRGLYQKWQARTSEISEHKDRGAVTLQSINSLVLEVQKERSWQKYARQVIG